METISYDEFPAKAHIALFSSVKNSKEIREKIIKASTAEGADGDAEREAVNFAFVDAKLIASKRHLLTAIYQSMLAESQKTLKTKTVHSEIIWSLNPTNNISEALRRFGVNNKSDSLLVVRVGRVNDDAEVERRIKEIVNGNLRPLNYLENITDWSNLSKLHKLDAEPALANIREESKRRDVIEELVTSFVAMKSIS